MTNNLATSLTNKVKKQSLIPSTGATASHFDSKGDYFTAGYRNVSDCQQQFYSGLRPPGRSYSTYLF